jgi:hypothetical protein
MSVIGRVRGGTGLAIAALGFAAYSTANEVIMIRPEIKATSISEPCPVRLDFRAYILADDFGDIEYRWIRSDQQQMPSETLALPARERKVSGYVSMTWEVSPLNSPGGREYWANVEILSPESLGSSGPARVTVECDGVTPGAQTGNSDSDEDTAGPNSLGDDAFVLGDASEEDTLIVGSTGETQTLAVPPVAPDGPAPRPMEFVCPVRQVGIQILDPLPAGWSRAGPEMVATGTLAGQTVANTNEGVRLVCLYQDGRWRLPLTRPIPERYKSCEVSGTSFRCTG